MPSTPLTLNTEDHLEAGPMEEPLVLEVFSDYI
jgi:hypothetical protein